MIYNYAKYNLDGLEGIVQRTVEVLGARKDEFDSIVVTGMSGVVVGVPAALQLGKPVVIVRKSNDTCHQPSPQRPEGSGEAVRLINAEKLGRRALFLDDFISLGSTQARVRKAVEERGARLSSRYLYYADDFTPVLDFDRRSGSSADTEVPF